MDLGGIPASVVAKQTLSRELARHGISQAFGSSPSSRSRPRAPSRILKKLSRAPGRDRAREGRRARRHRGLVRRRGPHRPKEQDHPPLGQARHAAIGAARTSEPPRLISSARSAPSDGKGCSPHPARLQHRGHEPAPGRNRHADRAGRTRGRFSSIRPAGICPAGSSCRPTSP